MNAHKLSALAVANLAILGAGLLLPSESFAQNEQKSRRVIEEVFVSAQKREEGIRDVPISLIAVDAAFLSEKGITDLSELSNFAPNVKLKTDQGAGIDLNIRGFSKQSGNPAFDQAVGLLIDGVSYNDNDYFVTGLMDLARIEILRGPQGTLLGKNTTAGLINVTTKNPSDTFGGYIDLQSGEFDQKRIEGAIGGPLIPGLLNFRIAGLSDKRDGTFENTTAAVEEDPRSFFPGVPERQVNRDRKSFRVKLEAPDLLSSLWRVQYERADVTAIGNGTEILLINQDTEDFLRGFDPGLDVTPGNQRGSENDPSLSERTVDSLVLTWERAFGEWNIKAVAARASVAGLVVGGDPTPAPLFGFSFDTEKPQDNLDIVLTSPLLFGGRVDFTAGLFYEERELDLDIGLDLNTEPFLALIAANDNSTSLVLPPSLLPPALSPDDALRESSTLFFDQETVTKALYGQLNWYFTENWEVTAGVRISTEDKDADIRRVFNTTNTALLTTTLGYEEFDVSLERDESTVQPKISVNYKFNDNISVFLHWARGFRAGGFNSAAGRSEGLEYEKEVVEEYALNIKTRLLDGSMQFNFGVFQMDLEDFQLLTSGPDDLSVVTVNAGRARAEGVEADLLWLPTDWLSLNAALGYNDATFTEFPFGPCAPGRANTDGDDDPRCDLTGTNLPFAPEWSGALALNMRVPFDRLPLLSRLSLDSLELIGGLDVEYQTVSTTGFPGDDRFTQGEYTRYGANIGIANPDSGWTLRVTGKNITDEAINRRTAPIPTTTNVVQDLEPPRTVYMQFRWNYE